MCIAGGFCLRVTVNCPHAALKLRLLCSKLSLVICDKIAVIYYPFICGLHHISWRKILCLNHSVSCISYKKYKYLLAYLIAYIYYTFFHKKKRKYIKLYNMNVHKGSSLYSFCWTNSLKFYLLITIYIFKWQWLMYKPCIKTRWQNWL